MGTIASRIELAADVAEQPSRSTGAGPASRAGALLSGWWAHLIARSPQRDTTGVYLPLVHVVDRQD